MVNFKLAELRKRKGMTQKELGDVFSVSMQTISKWETGAVYPDMTMLPVISAYFGVSVDKLLGVVPLDEEHIGSEAGKKEYWANKLTYLEQIEKNMWNEEYLQYLIYNVWKINVPVTILDCGCGYGALGLKLLPLLPKGSKYVGIDFSEAMIAAAKEHYKNLTYDYKFILADILEFNTKETFDIVISKLLLRHVNNGKEMLQKMLHFLKPGGLFVSIECNREFEAAGLYISGMSYEYLCSNIVLRNMWLRQKKEQNRDYSISMKIPQYLYEAGFYDIGCRMNDKVELIEPGMSNYNQELEMMIKAEEWFDDCREKRVHELINLGMTNKEAEEFYSQQRNISQHIKYNKDLVILKIRGMLITYGRKNK